MHPIKQPFQFNKSTGVTEIHIQHIDHAQANIKRKQNVVKVKTKTTITKQTTLFQLNHTELQIYERAESVLPFQTRKS